MQKKLTKTGNSLALVFDRPLLDKLGIDGNTVLEVSTDGTSIVISPARSAKRSAKLKKVSDWMFEEYAGVFKKLAE